MPAGLGNIVGGGLFCGGYYWWMYLFREPEIAVDGVHYDEVPLPGTSSLEDRRHAADVEEVWNGKAGTP